MKKVFHISFLCIFLLASTNLYSATLPKVLVGPNTQLSSYLEYILDETGTIDIEEAASPEKNKDYKPFNLSTLPHTTGVVWLRFSLPIREEGESSSTMLLDMGESVPDIPVLYEPVYNVLSGVTEWREMLPSQRNVLLIPEAKLEPITCYIRLDGLPGPWFNPMLRTPQDAASNLGSLTRSAALLCLGIVMLLCFLRNLSERGQWRTWTALYVGTALIQGLLGIPASGSGQISLTGLASVLSPGLALMLLPHVARHLLKTRSYSRVIDIQFVILSLPGAFLALLPLINDYSWIVRYLDIWPICTIIFLPSALAAWVSGLAGSKRFLLAIIIQVLSVICGLFGPKFGYEPNLLASLPLWGTALSALLIAGMRAPNYEPKEKGNRAIHKNDSEKVINLDKPIDSQVENVVHPLDDPNLRFVPRSGNTNTTPSNLNNPLLPPVGDNVNFNLQQILHIVQEEVSALAEEKGIGISWYMPPHLSHLYAGPGRELYEVLLLLVENAVMATESGTVQFSVRRLPGAKDPGQLIISVSDSGAGRSSTEQAGRSIARAWELAGAHHGFLSLETSQYGTTVIFVLQMNCLEHEEEFIEKIEDSQNAYVSEKIGRPPVPDLFGSSTETKEINSMPTLSDYLNLHIDEKSNDNLEISKGGDEWVGEPVAVTEETKEQKLHDIDNFSPEELILDNKEEEPVIIEKVEDKRSIVQDSTGLFNTPLNMSDEWVGEPTPILPKIEDKKEDIVDDKILIDEEKKSEVVNEEVIVNESINNDLPIENDKVVEEIKEEESRDSESVEIVENIENQSNIEEEISKEVIEDKTEEKVEDEKINTISNDISNDVSSFMDFIVGVSTDNTKTNDENIEEVKIEEKIELKNDEEVKVIAEEQVKLDFDDKDKNVKPELIIHSEDIRESTQDAAIRQMMERVDMSMDEAKQAFQDEKCNLVANAAARIAAEGDAFGLRVLARMARCVERAARANDLLALNDLLPELAVAVERNRIVCSQ